MRQHLPNERRARTRRTSIYTEKGEIKVYLTQGYDEDGYLAEIMLKIGKQGTNNAIYDLWATAISIALQYGIPLRVFLDKFNMVRMYSSSGITSDPDIPMCTSIPDYIISRLAIDNPEQV